MIELPPGWIPAYKAAADKAAFLRDWADEIYERACWTTDPERLTELIEALGGALGTALNSKGTPPSGPRHGDIIRTFSGRLWPDPDSGPWLILITWQVQDRTLVPVGIQMTSAADVAMYGPGHELADRIDDIGTPLTARLLRALPLGRIIAEDRDEMTEAADVLKAQAAG